MRSTKRSIGYGGTGILLLLLPQICSAAAGTTALVGFIQIHIINQALYAFGGIAAAAIFYYAARLIVDAHNEQSLTDVGNSFIYVLVGFIVIAISGGFANSFFFTGSGAGGSLNIRPDQLGLGLASATQFMITVSAGVFTLVVTVVGIRMITSQGDEAHFGKWVKILIGNCIGIVIMMIGSAIVTAVNNPRNPAAITNQLAGLAVFLLTIIGFTSVIALIIAGMLLIISIDESLRDRAKKMIIGTLIALVIVVASYTLLKTFV